MTFQVILVSLHPKQEKMENNLSLSVRMLCRKQGITMRQLAEKMQIAPESLSRAINGNPQLSTIAKIAECLNVEVYDLFNPALGDVKLIPSVKNLTTFSTSYIGVEEINPIKLINNELVAMVRFKNQTVATTDLSTLVGFVNTISKIKQATDNDDIEEV